MKNDRYNQGNQGKELNYQSSCAKNQMKRVTEKITVKSITRKIEINARQQKRNKKRIKKSEKGTSKYPSFKTTKKRTLLFFLCGQKKVTAKNTWVLRKRNSQNKSFIEKKTRLKKKNQFERREKSQTTPVAQVAKVDPKPLSYSKFRSRKKKTRPKKVILLFLKASQWRGLSL